MKLLTSTLNIPSARIRRPHPQQLRSAQRRCQQRNSPRRGSIFPYYMVYVVLCSALMMSAGLCLHSVLKADQFDADASRSLNVLRRLERTLRRDLTTSRAAAIDAAEMSLTDKPAGETIRWILNRNIAIRRTERDGTEHSVDRFVFPHTHNLTFRRGTDADLSALVIEEYPLMTKSDRIGPSDRDTARGPKAGGDTARPGGLREITIEFSVNDRPVAEESQ
ncbi:MAG: hypothetical protein KDA89_21015 [Planctomycetaceae bacterium]|nr:hypothetical protein [Planctomycetaceae bacterium]